MSPRHGRAAERELPLCVLGVNNAGTPLACSKFILDTITPAYVDVNSSAITSFPARIVLIKLRSSQTLT